MGAGRWSNDEYLTRSADRRAKGVSDFAYTEVARATGKVHDDVDPKVLAGTGSPFVGQVMRESRDSVDHPDSLPIAVFFDVTGSMSSYPRALQAKLPDLLTHLLDRVPDPQILVGAIGDANGDRVPLQVAQFESDNRIDEQLRNIYLEGGGGGGPTSQGGHESYELAFYFLGRHTDHDALNVRGRKGYAFLIGDERAYDRVNNSQVQQYIGAGTEDDLTMQDVVAEAQQKYEVYFIAVNNSYRSQNEEYWKGLVGDDHYLTLNDPADIVSIIGDAVAAGETARIVAAPLGTTTPVTP
jgi:hypothetical protein